MTGQASQFRTDNPGSSDFSPVETISTRAEQANSARARKASLARHASGRRRLVDPTTCERDYAAAEVEFMMAMNEYKRSSGRMFPTWSEVLEVLKALGYEKASDPAA
jgi:hypothetical protein